MHPSENFNSIVSGGLFACLFVFKETACSGVPNFAKPLFRIQYWGLTVFYPWRPRVRAGNQPFIIQQKKDEISQMEKNRKLQRKK